jgi:hypothetical protein
VQAKRLLSVRSAAQLAEVVAAALAGWARWAVGLHWLLEAAAAAGLHGTGEAACCLPGGCVLMLCVRAPGAAVF